jgi:hypothetical protein
MGSVRRHRTANHGRLMTRPDVLQVGEMLAGATADKETKALRAGEAPVGLFRLNGIRAGSTDCLAVRHRPRSSGTFVRND